MSNKVNTNVARTRPMSGLRKAILAVMATAIASGVTSLQAQEITLKYDFRNTCYSGASNQSSFSVVTFPALPSGEECAQVLDGEPFEIRLSTNVRTFSWEVDGTVLGNDGFGITGNNSREVDQEERFIVETSTGTAQGVSGVLLSNLYCGQDGENGGPCDTSDTASNNQASGEQGSVDIHYLDSTGALACTNFAFYGNSNLSDQNDTTLPDMQRNGEVYLDFGSTLSMVKAVLGTAIPETAGDCINDTNAGSAVGGNEYSVVGFGLDESEFVAVCNPTDGSEPEDPDRPCPLISLGEDPNGDPAIQADVKGEVDQADVVTVVQDVEVLVDDNCPADFPGNLDLASATREITLRSGLVVQLQPWHCGIPNAELGVRQLKCLTVNSNLQLNGPFIEMLVRENSNPAYDPDSPSYLGGADPFSQPAVLWIAKSYFDVPGQIEQPERAIGQLLSSNVMQDRTFGFGTYRGGWGRKSIICTNATRVRLSDIVATQTVKETIRAVEFARLAQYVEDVEDCATDKRGRVVSKLGSDVANAQKFFLQGRYDKSIGVLEELRSRINGRDKAVLSQCVYEPDLYIPPGDAGNPGGPGDPGIFTALPLVNRDNASGNALEANVVGNFTTLINHVIHDQVQKRAALEGGL